MIQSPEVTLEYVAAWDNLLLAWHNAARGKRRKRGAAAFEHQVADRLLALQAGLLDGSWRPGGYVHFDIHGPKRRRISAAPFADRVVHHALCNCIEPLFEHDMALLADSKFQLWAWKPAIIERLASLRLTVHEGSAQVTPVAAGVPWLGFVVYPTHRRLKARKAVEATRRLSRRFDAWRCGTISFGEFDASVQGWINHVRYADTWGLREHVLSRFVW